MPRKPEPVKLSRDTERHLSVLAAVIVHPKAQEAYSRYVAAATEYEEAWARLNQLAKIVDNPRRKIAPVDVHAYEEAMAAVEKAQKRMFGALDAYRHAEAHADDKQLAPLDDIAAIIKDVYVDNLDGIQFNVNSGLLAYHAARDAQKFAVESEEMEAPYCHDCQ